MSHLVTTAGPRKGWWAEMRNKSWKSVYIRLPNRDKPGQYKWVVVGKMYGYPNNIKVVLDEEKN